MKAINLVKLMVYDSEIAEYGGTVDWDRSISLRDYFGAESHVGEMEVGIYFYLYSDNEPFTISDMPVADVILKTDMDQYIYLWKLED
jgi:hypothetical protein